MPDESDYIHSYTPDEQERLTQQARMSEAMIHGDLDLSMHRNLLEIGCGTGGQTKILLERHPQLEVTAVDISETQLEFARRYLAQYPDLNTRVRFLHVDADTLPFDEASFDATFFCWVLEHAASPLQLLREAQRVLKPGGLAILTEVYNSTLHYVPRSPAIMDYWKQFNRLQQHFGGDPDVGVRLGRLLKDSGFTAIDTVTLLRHFDKRDLSERNAWFTYWEGLMYSAKEALLEKKWIDSQLLKSVADEFTALKADPDAIFFYVPIRAYASKP